VGYEGGSATWTGLVPGSYTVTENDPGSEWEVLVQGSPATVSVTTPASATVTNTYRVGKIKAVKTVNWNGYTPSPIEFEICLDSISGESATRVGCQPVNENGGTVEWTNLPVGTYRVVETAPPAPWTVQQQTTPFPLGAGSQHTVDITNSYDAARLDVTKVVQWNGPSVEGQVFEICIAGPSYPSGNCKTVDYDGGVLSWTGLLPGSYAVSESPGPEWQATLPGSISVTAGNNAATVTNTRKTGGLTVTKSVVWTGQPPPTAPASFEVCITGPSYPAGDCKTATFSAFSTSPAAQPLEWTNLQTGSYTVTETDPGASWEVSITGLPAVVTSGGTAYAGVQNRYVPPSCPVGPAPLEVPVPKENNPNAECAAYGLVPVCKADIGGPNTCGASLSYSTSGGSTTVSQLPPTARIFILKAGQYMIGIGYDAVPGTFANPEGKDLSHITVCGCPTP
jgi:hypothetical protein